MATNGSFNWNELMVRDVEAAKRFYGATLGWTFEAMEGGDGPTYWIAKVGDESVAGIVKNVGTTFLDVTKPACDITKAPLVQALPDYRSHVLPPRG